MHWLDEGSHTKDERTCLMEAVSLMAGEEKTDSPSCVDQYIASAGRILNDMLLDEERQGLLKLAPRMIGTRGDGLIEDRRNLMRAWTSVYCPTIRNLSPASAHAFLWSLCRELYCCDGWYEFLEAMIDPIPRVIQVEPHVTELVPA